MRALLAKIKNFLAGLIITVIVTYFFVIMMIALWVMTL